MMSLRYGCESDFLVTTTLYAYIFHHGKASCKKIWSRPGAKNYLHVFAMQFEVFRIALCISYIPFICCICASVCVYLFSVFISFDSCVIHSSEKKSPFSASVCHMNFQFILICMQSASMTKFSFVPHLFN